MHPNSHFIMQAGSVYWLKAMVIKYMRELTAEPGRGTILRIASGQPGLSKNSIPTLTHVADFLKQVRA